MYTFPFSFERFGETIWVRFPVDSQDDKLSDTKVETIRNELERGFCVIADSFGYHVASFDLEGRAWQAVGYREVIITRTGKVMLCVDSGK